MNTAISGIWNNSGTGVIVSCYLLFETPVFYFIPASDRDNMGFI
ncbi:hypothetical protein [Lacrimispora sp.]